MPVKMQRKKATTAMREANQVCARGWQDYMLETSLLAEEANIDSYLKVFLNQSVRNVATPVRRSRAN